MELELLANDRFALRFPYNAALVERLRTVKGRRWNKDEAQWEMPLAALDVVCRMMGVEPATLDRRLARAFKIWKIRNSRVRIVSGNVESRVLGGGLPIEKIEDATSFFVPGYQFMPLYVKGRWDGRRRLFSKRSQTFPTGLLDRIVTILRDEGIEFDVQPPDAAASASPEHPSIGTTRPRFALRDYQRECADAALRARRGVLELATGAGKTAIAAHLIHEIGRPALFIVHTRDLLHQTREYLAEHLRIPVGQIGDGVIDIRPVSVATVQTCAKVLGMKPPRTTDDDETLERDPTNVAGCKQELLHMIQTREVMFFDECHHLPAETFYQLAMETHGAAWRFGLSATPYRADRLDLLLEAALGPKLYQANASVLIGKKYLVPPRIRFLQPPALPPSRADADYQAVVLRYIVTNPGRNAMIADEARRLGRGRNAVLILVSQVRHGEILQSLMPGVPLVQGSDPAERRKGIFEALGRHETPVVIATTLADEGLDIPALNAVILASGGRSETRALQRLGRALRPAPGKKEAVVIDFADSGPYIADHARQRIDIFQSEPAFRVEVEGSMPERAPKKASAPRKLKRPGKT